MPSLSQSDNDSPLSYVYWAIVPHLLWALVATVYVGILGVGNLVCWYFGHAEVCCDVANSTVEAWILLYVCTMPRCSVALSVERLGVRTSSRSPRGLLSGSTSPNQSAFKALRFFLLENTLPPHA